MEENKYASFGVQNYARTIANEDQERAALIKELQDDGVLDENGKMVDDVEAEKNVRAEKINSVLEKSKQMLAPSPAQKAVKGERLSRDENGTAEDVLGSKEGVGYQVVAGAADAVQSTYNLGVEVTKNAAEYFDINQSLKKTNFASEYFPQSDRFANNFLRGTTQFLAGFFPASKALGAISGVSKAVKAGQATKAATTGLAMTSGAVADFVTFEGDSKNIVDFVNSFPETAPIVQGLLKDPNSSEMAKRLHNSISGLGFGLGVDAVTQIAKGVVNGVKFMGHKKGVQKALEEVDKIESGAQNLNPNKEIAADAPVTTPKIDPNTINAPVAAAKTGKNLPIDPPSLTIDEVKATLSKDAGDLNVKGGENINLEALTEEDGLKTIIKNFAEKNKDALEGMLRTLDERESLSMLADTLRTTVANVTKTEVGRLLPRETYTLVAMVRLKAGQLKQLAEKAFKSQLPEDEVALLQAALEYETLFAAARGETRLASRKMNAIKEAYKAFDEVGVDPDNISQMLDLYGTISGKHLAARMNSQFKTVKDFAKYGEKRMMGEKIDDVVFEIYRNNLLFNAGTMVTNVLSNNSSLAVKAVSRYFGGLKKAPNKLNMTEYNNLAKKRDALYSKDPSKMGVDEQWAHKQELKRIDDTMAEALNNQGLSFKENNIYATKLLKKSWEETANQFTGFIQNMKGLGKSIFESEGKVATEVSREALEGYSGPALTGKNIKNPVVSKGVDIVGNIQRLSSKGLLWGDSIHRSISMTAEVAALAYRHASSLGLEGDALFKEADRLMKDPPAFIYDKAMQSTLENLYQNDLGGMWKIMDSAFKNLGRHELGFAPLRYLFPFSRTGFNVTQDALEYLPVPGFRNLSGKYREAMARGGADAQIAKGKADFAKLIMASAGLMAFNGKITGSAPRDPKLRKEYLANHPENSIEIGGKWYPYNKLGVFGKIISYSADLVQMTNEFFDENDMIDPQISDFIQVLAHETLDYMEPEYLLQNFSALIESMETGEISPQFKKMPTNFVPLMGLVGEVRDATDTVYRDTTADPNGRWDLIEAVFNNFRDRTPFFSKGGEPYLNRWGDEIKSPPGWGVGLSVFFGREYKNDPIDVEMDRLGYYGKFMDPDPREGENFLAIPPISKTLRYDGGTVVLTHKQRNELIRLTAGKGPMWPAPYSGPGLGEDIMAKDLRDMLSQVINLPSYKELTDEGKRKVIKGVFSDVEKAAKEVLISTDKEIGEKWMKNKAMKEMVLTNKDEEKEEIQGQLDEALDELKVLREEAEERESEE